MTSDSAKAPAAEGITAKTPSSPTTAKPPGQRVAMPPHKQDQAAGRLDAVLVTAVLVLAFLLASFSVKNSDFWMHLATGRAIVQGQYTFGKDTFSYSTEGVYWVNHSWLYDVFSYLGYTMFGEALGGSLLVFVKALLVAGIAALMLLYRKPGGSFWIPAAVTGLCVLVLSPRLIFQPTLLSFLFLVLTLFLLHKHRTTRWLRLLVPMFVLWVNVDAWFILGPIVVGLWLVGEVMTGLFRTSRPETRKSRKPAPPPPPIEPLPPLKPLLLVFAVSLAACVLNPHTIWAFSTLPVELSWHPYAVELSRQRLFESLFYSPLQTQFYREAFGLNVAGLSFFVLLIVGAASFLIDAKNLSWSRLLVWLTFAAFALWRAYAIGFFAVVSGPILILNFQAAALRYWPGNTVKPALDPTPTLKSLAVILGIFTAVAIVTRTSLLSYLIDQLTKLFLGQDNVSQELGLPTPLNLAVWIEANRHLLKPPVGNHLLHNGDFIIMVVGGPNQRSDFHVNPTEEMFFQVEGDIVLRVLEDGTPRDIPIRQGELFLLPPNVPHSPQRPANTVGLVLERRRPPTATDHLRWYCRGCGSMIYDAEFEMVDLGKQLKPIIEYFHGSESARTCKACGSVFAPPTK